VVDNASQDGSADFIREKFPKVHLVVNSQNRGYAGGCNDGTQVTSGDFLLFFIVKEDFSTIHLFRGNRCEQTE